MFNCIWVSEGAVCIQGFSPALASVAWATFKIKEKKRKKESDRFKWGNCILNLKRRKHSTNITVAGSADAEVGEVGGQAARAVGRAEQGEGHGVVGVQRGGQRRRKLDVGQIGKWATGVVCSWKHRRVQLLVWWREYTERQQFVYQTLHSVMCRDKLMTNESDGSKHDCVASQATNKLTLFLGRHMCWHWINPPVKKAKPWAAILITSATHFFFPRVPSCHPTAAPARLCLRSTPSSPSPALLAAVLISDTAKTQLLSKIHTNFKSAQEMSHRYPGQPSGIQRCALVSWESKNSRVTSRQADRRAERMLANLGSIVSKPRMKIYNPCIISE